MRWRAALVIAALLGSPHAHAATLFDPALRFRTIATDHFIIYFHQGESALAARLAGIAEQTWRALQQPLGVTPPARTHVVLADQTEFANGYATPVPYDTIVIYTVAPAGSEFIGNADDWLRVVFTHEFTHIVHLDRSEGWARYLRGVFGRTTLAFPNLFLPTWQIEGLATYEETALTGLGRVHAGDFTALVEEAARRHVLEPIDRVNGGLTDWPGGNGPYAYGAGFHEYLARRFGAATLAQLANDTARALPYTGSRAFRRVFGESLGELWRDYEASLPSGGAVEAGTPLTHRGFTVVGPRFDRASPREVIYSVQDPDGFPAMYRINLDTRRDARLATRYLGSTTAPGRTAVYFDQQEVRRNVGSYSDLYALDRTSGRVTALTHEARVLDPDLSPDETTMVAVQDRPGARDLVAIDLAQDARTRVLVADDGTQFNAPRWSPDGRRIAVERHRRGALPDVVVVDVATREVHSVASIAGARVVTPAWRPDGRAIVAAVAREGEPFNLYEFSTEGTSEVRPLTHTTGGATWPDVSPDGTTIVFVGYTPAGFDLFVMPYPTAGGVRRADSLEGRQPLPLSAPTPSTREHDYSPWPTLTPTSWSPILVTDSSQVRAGALVAGADVLGYHAWSASATWLVSGPADATRPSSASPDWQLAYVYDRWQPTLFAAASTATSFFAGPPTDAGTPTNATLRERQLEAGVLVPIRHTRVSHSALVSLLRSLDEYTIGGGVVDRDRTAIRAAWATNTSHVYGYSISPEGGVNVGATVEAVRAALGSSADATVATADARVYLPGAAPHHVVALRAAAGVSTGDVSVGRTFLLGGSNTDLGVASFSSRAVGLLRGFASNTFAGRRATVVNADYRVPIARPQRGDGTWPLLLHTLSVAAFVDAGDAWNSGRLRADAIKTSVGGELSTSIVAGYVFPFTLAGGVAWGRDPTGVVGSGATAYLRVGKAF
ncbi:MAG TPA: BamA/TamA family outer membrane protein [Vicinamibacterales bacterium]|nr:BamA/TamA family outer membrane protein [Vicinamibacterales bacterium]